MLGKRGEGLTINKLILIILAILVLLALLMFIFKVDILEWLRNLPDYTYEEDKEIDPDKISPDALLQLRCTKQIAVIGEKDAAIPGHEVREMFIFVDNKRIRKIGLYVDVDDSKNYIIETVKLQNLRRGVVVGEVKDKTLKINRDILANYDSIDGLKKAVALRDLEMLDGSHLILTRLFCKTEEEIKKECKIDDLELGSYRLREGKLEYLNEDNNWMVIDGEIPTQEQTELREEKDNVISKKNKLKLGYNIKDYEVKLDSQEGLYFEVSSLDKYIYTGTTVYKYTYEREREYVVSDIEQNLLESFSAALQEQNLTLGYSNEGFLLYLSYDSPFITQNIYYGVNQFNYLYKSNSPATKEWEKFDENEHEYLYIPAEEWKRMKEWIRIKQELITCEKRNEN